MAKGHREDNPAGDATSAALPKGEVLRSTRERSRMLMWPGLLRKVRASNA